MNDILRNLFIGDLSWTRVARSLVLIPIFVYMGLCLLAWLVPDKLIFRPQTPSYRDGPDIIKLKTAPAETISAKFYENEAAVYTILFSHGNAEDIGHIGPFAERLRDSGFAVLTYDYRGYGTSQGTPSESNSYGDIDAAYKYLTVEQNISPARIILHGRSLGGGPAVDLASRERVAGLIMESTFTSASRVATRIKILPVDRFESIDKIGRVRCPVLFIHGKRDWTIPFHHGVSLFETAHEPKASLWIETAGHNNVFETDRQAYLNAIRDFAATFGE